MNIPITPAPRRPIKPGASLRTQRPTTYYDNDKDPSLLPNPSERTPRPKFTNDGFPAGKPNQNRLPNPVNNPMGVGVPSRKKPPTGKSNEKSKIGAALLNRRQSVSYGNAPVKSTPQPMPPMPVLPSRFGRIKNEDQIVGVGSKNQKSLTPVIQVDTETLSLDNFDAEKFMMIHLATLGGDTSDPESLKIFKDSLRAAHLNNNQSLQENAYQNYGAFVAVSKEIATLENEMFELKSVLEEFKTLPNDLDMGLGMNLENNSSGELKRKLVRNSILDVNELYKNQLERLWEQVEGSQKFLPIKPGRHIVLEIKSFVELNPITYQPKQNVHIFLLDDQLLIAIRKPSTVSSSTNSKLMAEKCFNLLQISIMDLDDKSDLKNAIQIQRNQEKVILKTNRHQDKREFLHSFKKVSEELSRRKRKQSMLILENKTLSSNDLYNRGSQILSNGLENNLLNNSGKDDSITKRIFSEIGDLMDEITVGLACKKFEEAIELIERSRKKLFQVSSKMEEESSSSSRHSNLNQDHKVLQPFKLRIEQKTQELMNKLLEDLSEPSLRKSRLVKICQLIFRINGSNHNAHGNEHGHGHQFMNSGPFIERAKESFLSMRSDLVIKQISQIKFEGDHLIWVSQSSFVLFTLIKNTCEWYMTAFKDNRMASGFVSWAVESIECYGEIFRRQIFDGEEDLKTIKDSILISKIHAGMLKEVGLDFEFLLDCVLNKEADKKNNKSGKGRFTVNYESSGTESKVKSMKNDENLNPVESGLLSDQGRTSTGNNTRITSLFDLQQQNLSLKK